MYISKNFQELFMPWLFNCSTDLVITDIQLDSRRISKSNLFVALKGSKTDGRLYINHAIKKGAAAVLSTSDKVNASMKHIWSINNDAAVPIIECSHLNQYLSQIAGRFYDDPSHFLNVIGVTGTNGKTSITHLLTNWIQLLGGRSAVMGTLGNGVLNDIHPTHNTTCSAVDTQRVLSQFVKNKIKLVAMEVSSHGLDQYRVDAVYFKVAVFSNLSHDHLDYHGNFFKYKNAKWRLFNELYVEQYVINIDDIHGYQWLSLLSEAVAVTSKDTLPNFWKGRWICVTKLNLYIYGTDIFFNSSWGSGIIHSQLLGMFNVTNVLLALGALLVIGYPLSSLLHVSSQLKPICGRLEIFRSCFQPTVIVDYAHTPDALKQVLKLIKSYCYGQLWCVFGCGGDRDRNKRRLMGSIADKYANCIIVTNDNPRTENSKSIIHDIVSGIKHIKNTIIITDRVQAIKTAISKAKLEDVVLIAGKGHERYQIIGNDYIDHSDQRIVKESFKIIL